MSYTIEKINANIEETFVKKYGVCIDGGMPQTATGLEALCHRVYNKGWADCRERMLNKSWIPCSERLPEENGNYLCTYGKNRIEVFSFAKNLYDVDHYDFIDKRKAGFYANNSEWGYCEIDAVIAWMPLPPAYKESED